MKLDDLKAIGRRVEVGAWVQNPLGLDGLTLKVRAFGNADYMALFAKLAAEYGAEKMKDESFARAIDTKLIVETVLVDWQIEDLPYSPEAALQLLNDPDPAMRIFRRAVNWAANNVQQFGIETLDTDAKNSSQPADGSSPTA